MPYVEILNLPFCSLKFVLLILGYHMLSRHSPGQNPSLISKCLPPVALMIKPKPLLSPVFKDLYKPRTIFQSHCSLNGILYCWHSGLPCSLSPPCLCFLQLSYLGTFPNPATYTAPLHILLPTQNLQFLHMVIYLPLLNLQSIYRPYYIIYLIVHYILF